MSNKYKVGDKISFKTKAVWSGHDTNVATITGIDYDDDFGWFYYTDLKRNSQPLVQVLPQVLCKHENVFL